MPNVHWLVYISLVVVFLVAHATLSRQFTGSIPFLPSLTLAFGVSFLVALLMTVLFNKEPIVDLKSYLPFVFIGIAIAGINIVFLAAFAAGAPVGVGPAIANISASMILFFVGLFYFGEALTITQFIGIVFGCAGLFLVVKG